MVKETCAVLHYDLSNCSLDALGRGIEIEFGCEDSDVFLRLQNLGVEMLVALSFTVLSTSCLRGAHAVYKLKVSHAAVWH